MPDTPESDKTLPLRDANGRFIKKGSSPQDAVVKESLAETPLTTIGKGVDPSIEKPLVSVTVNNPFKKLLYWLDEIRRKQTTTFDFKIKIPLIALPIFLLVLGGVFQFFWNQGHTSNPPVTPTPVPSPIITTTPIPSLPQPLKVTRLGTIKATYQVQNLITPSAIPTEEITNDPLPTAIPPTPSRYVLVGENNHVFFLVGNSINFNTYLNQKVLVTGMYNQEKETLTIEKIEDIELLQ